MSSTLSHDDLSYQVAAARTRFIVETKDIETGLILPLPSTSTIIISSMGA